MATSRVRRVVFAYVAVGTTLAVVRLSLYAWIVHHYVTETVTETVVKLQDFVVYPEALLSIHTTIGRIEPPYMFVAVFSLLLAVGSFVMTSPVLLLAFVNVRSDSVSKV